MKRLRVGTVLSLSGLALSFALAAYLHDPTPFTVVAPIAIGGKWFENYAERRYPTRSPDAA